MRITQLLEPIKNLGTDDILRFFAKKMTRGRSVAIHLYLNVDERNSDMNTDSMVHTGKFLRQIRVSDFVKFEMPKSHLLPDSVFKYYGFKSKSNKDYLTPGHKYITDQIFETEYPAIKLQVVKLEELCGKENQYKCRIEMFWLINHAPLELVHQDNIQLQNLTHADIKSNAVN